MHFLTELVCDICGASQAKSGRPFDRTSLAKHMAKVHPPEEQAAASSSLVCDICGVNQSSSGKRFTIPSQVWQHKKKRHPGALNFSTAPDRPIPVESMSAAPEPASTVDSPPIMQASKRSRAPSATQLNHNSHVQFCPCCGFHLAVVNAAMEFVSEEPSWSNLTSTEATTETKTPDPKFVAEQCRAQ